MEAFKLNTGIREFKINDRGVLRFNPSDPSIYSRFMDAGEKIQALESKMIEDAKKLNTESDDNHGTLVLKMLTDTDREVKKILADVFGNGNDFDEILEGVNLMAVGTNGERIITNFLNAIAPIFQEGIESFVKQSTDNAVQQTQQNRAARRAKPKA